MKKQAKQTASIKALSEMDMQQITGGTADFSDVQGGVSSTDEMWSTTPTCFGNPDGGDFFCYYMKLN